MRLARKQGVSRRTLQSMRRTADATHNIDIAVRRASNMDLLIYVIVLLIVVFSLRMFFFSPTRVDGDSMDSTLLDGERMFVEKVSYWVNDVARDDIVICFYPNHTISCVKRVVGIAGDTLEISEGILYRNGEAVDESEYWNGVMNFDMELRVVPEDTVFVMGDNRNGSGDSRHDDVGPIPLYRIVGRARSVVWPLDNYRKL